MAYDAMIAQKRARKLSPNNQKVANIQASVETVSVLSKPSFESDGTAPPQKPNEQQLLHPK